jgi:hypothetical protein
MLKRSLAAVMGIDVAMLVMPTAWLGSRTEFALALALAACTGLLWYLDSISGGNDRNGK